MSSSLLSGSSEVLKSYEALFERIRNISTCHLALFGNPFVARSTFINLILNEPLFNASTDNTELATSVVTFYHSDEPRIKLYVHGVEKQDLDWIILEDGTLDIPNVPFDQHIMIGTPFRSEFQNVIITNVSLLYFCKSICIYTFNL